MPSYAPVAEHALKDIRTKRVILSMESHKSMRTIAAEIDRLCESGGTQGSQDCMDEKTDDTTINPNLSFPL